MDLDLGCNGPISRPLGVLLNEICSEAAGAATQAFFETIGQIKTGVETVESTVDSGVTFLDGQLTAAKDAIDAEIAAAETFVDGQIGAARDDVNGKIDAVKNAIDGRIATAETFVVGRVTEINDASLVIEQDLADALSPYSPFGSNK